MEAILRCLGFANSFIREFTPLFFLQLGARFFLAAVFFLSGRTKVEPGTLLSVSENTVFLFEHEYNLPFISPVIAAYLATYAENILSVLVFFGLFTRLSAFALLVMTLVIQIFVYPEAYVTHLGWVVSCLVLTYHGGGALSVDKRLLPYYLH